MSSIDKLGLDKEQRPRVIFFYDGGCGVCKFLVGFVSDRDHADRVRFSPIQTKFALDTLNAHNHNNNNGNNINMPTDVSTAVLIDENGRSHAHSSSVLILFRYMGIPYIWIGFVALLIPVFIRDGTYRIFAKNRGAIWKGVKRVTGMGDTQLDGYRDRILGLEEPIDPKWGFDTKKER
jgi:predicted DCC family thiol-disulfide oxidoreductase YuxK